MMSSKDAFISSMPFVRGFGASMIVNRMLAAPAACVAEVTGPAIPPMDITIVMMDVSILFGVKFTLQVMQSKEVLTS